MEGIIDYLKVFWPFIGTFANFCFPFVSELKKESIHFDNQTKSISNILSGIATSAVVLILYFERHQLHWMFRKFPQWYWLIFTGIGLITLHCALVFMSKEWNKQAVNLSKGLGIIIYVFAFSVLSLGFNLPVVENLIYVSVSGKVSKNCEISELQLIKNDKMVAMSRIMQINNYRVYRFLLLPKEIESGGLKIRAFKNKEVKVRYTDSKYPQLDLDIDCK
jgi:hypothetical protein